MTTLDVDDDDEVSVMLILLLDHHDVKYLLERYLVLNADVAIEVDVVSCSRRVWMITMMIIMLLKMMMNDLFMITK